MGIIHQKLRERLDQMRREHEPRMAQMRRELDELHLDLQALMATNEQLIKELDD